jgi:hypothetical protein
MRRVLRSFKLAARVTVVVVALAFAALAQYQVNRQVGPMHSPSAGSVRYANVAARPTVTSNLLPSEARNAYYKSGALPSEVRMNFAAVGPLAPSGVRAYIPPPTPVTGRPSAGPQGNRIDPTVGQSFNSGLAPSATVQSPAISAAQLPSIRYGELPPAPAAQPVAGSAMPAWATSLSAMPMNPTNFVTPTAGSIHYVPGN